MNLLTSSEFTGAINSANTAKTVNLVIDSDSTWTLTGDSYVTSLTNNGTIDYDGYTLYVNGNAQ